MNDLVHHLPALLFVRHGETAWNAAGRIQGQMETELTARGLAQAQAVAMHLSARLGKAAGELAIHASPMRRARQTLAPILAALGRDETAVCFDARLKERHFGEWQGRPRAEMLKGAGFDIPRERARYFHWRPVGGGESLADVCARVEAFLHDLVAAGRPALIVAHGGTFRALSTLLLGASEEEAARMKIPQGAICHIRAGRAAWQLCQAGEDVM